MSEPALSPSETYCPDCLGVDAEDDPAAVLCARHRSEARDWARAHEAEVD